MNFLIVQIIFNFSTNLSLNHADNKKLFQNVKIASNKLDECNFGSFDCKSIRANFDSKAKSNQQSLVSVLSESCHIQYDDARINGHYFQVKLDDLIGEGNRLLEFDYICDCLTQVAPVDFNKEEFIFGSEVYEALTLSDIFATSTSKVIC